MDPHQVEGLNLTEYFYFDDHHPYDLTGHRCAERAALLLDGSGCVQHGMKQLAATALRPHGAQVRSNWPRSVCVAATICCCGCGCV